ncbi:COG complex component COG2 protein [Dioscorea alata]|uniref:COG complex component COG2 protein n=1 Tax=Dioscorea alata TaxID=55571 RepID=A0ACB7UTV2_DIOAL|nr:COG complex component COG2 protein [Dioscorea alata]
MPELHPSRSPAELFGDSPPHWLEKSAFNRPDFDAEAYISSLRSFVPLENLSVELQAHVNSLQAELVDLINRDYADFVSLTAQLVDVDAAAARMREPLVEFRGKVAALRTAVDASLASLLAGLRQRAAAEQAREVIELLIDSAHVVSKVEKLIKELPSTPTDWSTVDDVPAEKGPLAEINTSGTSIRETQSILLERIASEMNRLKFYVSHSEGLPFLENMKKRIHEATSSLDGSLGHCFVNGLEHRDANAIYNCLRAYAAIDNTTAAEELFGKTIVSPLIQKVIPHDSPVVGGVSSELLEEDYQQIMDFISNDCKFLLDISSSANSGLHVFDFLANSILKEVLLSIQKRKPGAFSPGRPTEFLKNYKSSMLFLDYLEGYCASRSAVTKFRSAPVYVDFMRQWNVGVYFSLRFQEIAGTLDSVLTVGSISLVDDLNDNEGKDHELLMRQSVALMESLRSCWNEDVIVFSSADKFLRLSLQLISRFSSWLSSGLEARKTHHLSSNSTTNSGWAIAADVEDFIYVMHDVRLLITELTSGFLANVIRYLESCSADVLDIVKESFLHAAKSLEDSVPAIMDTMIEGTAVKCIEDLKHLKGITATYRMTNKLPVRHSPYVSGVLRPLKAFIDGDRVSHLTNEARHELLLGIAERITIRYHDFAADVVNVARKTETSLLRLRQGAQRRVGASSDTVDNNISDTEKICMQIFLDIQEYGRNLAAFGIRAADIPAYRSLWQLVAPEDRQTDIVF